MAVRIPFLLWQLTSCFQQDHLKILRVLTSFVLPIHNQGVSVAFLQGHALWSKFLPTTGSFFLVVTDFALIKQALLPMDVSLFDYATSLLMLRVLVASDVLCPLAFCLHRSPCLWSLWRRTLGSTCMLSPSATAFFSRDFRLLSCSIRESL